MKHKHADLIHAWADGAEIQAKSDDVWLDCVYPTWYSTSEYRIKPEPKPDFVHKTRIVMHEKYNGSVQFDIGPSNLQLTFDGGTGKLKGAEVL